MRMKLLGFIFFLLTSAACFGQDQWKNIYTENAWKERDQWQRPEDIVKWLQLTKGSNVADIGSHEGYMTVKLASKVGVEGKVFAVDVLQNRLNLLADHLKERGIVNVITIKGDYDNPHLEPNSLNGALIIDTYHEMDNHDDMLSHIKLALKLGGRLVVCEPIATDRKTLSRSEQERKHELGMNFALQDLQKAGFKIVFKQDPYIDREKIKGDKMWIIVASK